MIVTLPVFKGDVPRLRDLLQWIQQLGGCPNHRAVIVADADTPVYDVLDLRELAAKAFKDCDIVCTESAVTGWPAGPNALFLKAAQAGEEIDDEWLFLEPDAVPLRAGWLDAIDIRQRATKARYMGALVPCSTPGLPPLHMDGVAVYPPYAYSELAPIVKANPGVAFDISTAEFVCKDAVQCDLFQHLWGEKDNPPRFAAKRVPKTAVFDLDYLNEKAAIFHRNKDGSLIRLLRRQLQKEKGPTIVSLRRAGDIIALLPALYRQNCRTGKRPSLVVHREFAPVLEGVSYVDPIIWDGDWEDPLEAARVHDGINAQVFGKRVVTNTRTGNFVLNAWTAIGERWNRHAPLVFDMRDYQREAGLAASVFKTSLPKVLLKLHGFSSPFKNAQVLVDEIQKLTECEIINLDTVRAERIYDLIGLMDRAAIMVSIDTATLHLAQASTCPVVALVNGIAFAGTPPRGNLLLRVPYEMVPTQIGNIVSLVQKAIKVHTPNSGIALVFSDFIPTDPKARKRQDAAYLTWPLLGARLHPFRAIRTSRAVGDNREMPFVKDMIESAFATGDEWIVVLTNNDIKFSTELAPSIRESCKQCGCYWAYRTEFQGGPTDEGADVFAFTRQWWNLHRHLLPDFLLGYPWWDSTLVRIMMASGCDEGPRVYYHETHLATDHRSRLQTFGTRHNEHLGREWLVKFMEDEMKATRS